MSTAIAKNLMAEMKLLGMFAAYDQAITDATRDQTGYSEFLDTLLQAETIGPGSGTTSDSTRAPRPPSTFTASASAALTPASSPSA